MRIDGSRGLDQPWSQHWVPQQQRRQEKSGGGAHAPRGDSRQPTLRTPPAHGAQPLRLTAPAAACSEHLCALAAQATAGVWAASAGRRRRASPPATPSADPLRQSPARGTSVRQHTGPAQQQRRCEPSEWIKRHTIYINTNELVCHQFLYNYLLTIIANAISESLPEKFARIQ